MIGLFIDGSHLSICWRDVSSQQIDFIKLKIQIEATLGDTICEAYCFDATSTGLTNGYFKAMERCGIRVKLYHYAFEPVYGEGHQPIIDPRTGKQATRWTQKGVDVGLAIHMLESHRRKGWNRLVLAAADSDFAEPVQGLVEHDAVELTTLGLPEKTSHCILPYAARRIDLREIAHLVERPALSVAS